MTYKRILLLSAAMLLLLRLNAREYKIDVSRTTVPAAHLFHLGADTSPAGKRIEVSSSGLIIDGKPVLPVMGEFHYARYPEKEWRRELLKMKAGGVNIIATYVFWIHHEEQEGVYDWSGCRNLRAFVEACKSVGLPIVLRLGPWCHGEVRNGGFPEWLLKRQLKLRTSDAIYMKEVRAWYAEIYRQVKGLMWKDGGPVIGVQLENEYRGPGSHLMALKAMARETGFDVPLYTRTGWPKLSSPVDYGEILPLYGDYADGFWDRSLKPMPGDYAKSFIFRSFRNSTVIATEQLPRQSDKDNPDDNGYPYFTCELGGGMATSYHRRIVIDPMDVYSMSLVRVGSGSNMPGYYVYHSGTNPDGRFTSLNESQASPYTNHNDLPVKTYDYQSPLGEFGQMNPHYHLLRRFHLFLADFGDRLSSMPPCFPRDMETDFRRDSLLRWTVRSDGNSGYVFVNNYERLKTLTAKRDITFTVNTRRGALSFPEKPMTIGAGKCFIMPFNLDMDGITLTYATAQPVASMTEGSNTVYVFARIEGIAPEFAFGNIKNRDVISAAVKPYMTAEGKLVFSHVTTGYGPAVSLRASDGHTVKIVLLDEAASLSLWKAKLAGRERLFISSNGLTTEKNTLELTCEDNQEAGVSVYPAPSALSFDGKMLKGRMQGIFTRYTLPKKNRHIPKVTFRKLKEAAMPVREIKFSKAHLPMQPEDADFDKAAVWQLSLPAASDADYRLAINYTGDVARIYSGDRLLDDNFYNGKPFVFGIKRYMPDISNKPLLLKVLPLQKTTPIYLPVEGLDKIKDGTAALRGINVTLTTRYKLTAE